jgi:hypothetical protein
VVEDSGHEGKLGQGFSSLDSLEEVDLGDESMHKPTYISAKLSRNERVKVCCLVKEFTDYFVWSYMEVPDSSRDLVEHKLLINWGFMPYKQPARSLKVHLGPRVGFGGLMTNN